jgi:FMN phosphatase YigB (HAD superfamily)
VLGGVDTAFAQLTEYFQLVLVSNGPSDLQRLKLDRAGMTKSFDALGISGDLGTAMSCQRF